jgi:hypothetical protein
MLPIYGTTPLLFGIFQINSCLKAGHLAGRPKALSGMAEGGVKTIAPLIARP